MSWAEEMVDGLLEQRAAGVVDFAVAWRRASAACARPRDFVVRGDAPDPDWLPFSSFFREACRREWEGKVHADYMGLREMLAESTRTARHGHHARRVAFIA